VYDFVFILQNANQKKLFISYSVPIGLSFRVQAQTYYQKLYNLKASHQCVLGNEADKTKIVQITNKW
jgi:hypothetical protein